MMDAAPFRWLLWSHLAATWALVGLIWTIQVLQYPIFAKVGESAFGGYHAAHSARITVIVLPLMLWELASAVLLVSAVAAPISTSIPLSARWLGLALVAVIWISTFALQVPQHNLLSSGFDAVAHQRLVASNWIRTVAWTLRGGLVLWMADRWISATTAL